MSGLANASGEVVVALDADTQFNADTISRLVRWFADPEIGAVAGNAKVGNRINMITRWQALEYIVAQNLERRALSALDTLTVVPGAVGRLAARGAAGAGRLSRRHAGRGPGPHHRHPDRGLSRAVRSARHRLDRSARHRAAAWPSSASAGPTARCNACGNIAASPSIRDYGALGMVALPQVWLFQILLTTLAPLADLLLVWQLVGAMDHLSPAWRGILPSDNLRIVGIYYGVFIVVDLLAALVGFLMERREDWRLLWWLLLQRFGYRQIMYYVVVRSHRHGAARPLCRLGQAGTPRHGQGKVTPFVCDAVMLPHQADAAPRDKLWLQMHLFGICQREARVRG